MSLRLTRYAQTQILRLTQLKFNHPGLPAPPLQQGWQRRIYPTASRLLSSIQLSLLDVTLQISHRPYHTLLRSSKHTKWRL